MQKHVNLVDLVKSFPTNIYLQNLASMQKRTSPAKFAHFAEKSGKGSISNLSTKVGDDAPPGDDGPGVGDDGPGDDGPDVDGAAVHLRAAGRIYVCDGVLHAERARASLHACTLVALSLSFEELPIPNHCSVNNYS